MNARLTGSPDRGQDPIQRGSTGNGVVHSEAGEGPLVMSTRKSPGRELAERMWYDVTGYRPGMKEGSSPATRSEDFCRENSSRVTVSIPDLDQPVEPVVEGVHHSKDSLGRLPYAAAASLVAGAILGGMFMWAFLFTGKREPLGPHSGSLPPPHQVTVQLSHPAEAGKPNVAQSERQAEVWPGLPAPHQSAGAVSSGIWRPADREEKVEAVKLQPSLEGWGLGDTAPTSPASSGPSVSVAWKDSVTPTQLHPNHQAQAAVGEGDPGISLPAGGGIAGTAGANGVIPASHVGQGIENPSVVPGSAGNFPEEAAEALRSASFNATAPTNPPPSLPIPGQSYPATSIEPTSSVEPKSANPSGINAGPSGLAPAASSQQVPSPNLPTQAALPSDTSAEKSLTNLSGEKISGIAWLRGEREFTISRKGLADGSLLDSRHAMPVNFRFEQEGNLPVTDPGEWSTTQPGGSPVATSSFPGNMPASSFPGNMPCYVPASGERGIGQLYSPGNPLYLPAYPSQHSAPSDGILPSGMVFASPGGPTNSQVIVNPTVVPPGAWQNVDASSFRWSMRPGSGGTIPLPPAGVGANPAVFTGGSAMPPGPWGFLPGHPTPVVDAQTPMPGGMPVVQSPGHVPYQSNLPAYSEGLRPGETANLPPVTAWGSLPGNLGNMNR